MPAMTITDLAAVYPLVSNDEQERIDIEITKALDWRSNRWRYAWRRVILDENGLWVQDTENPLSQDSPGYGYAYNTIETNNTATGVQGSGDDLSDFPDNDIDLLPIGSETTMSDGASMVKGAVIVDALLHRSEFGDLLEVYFSAPNNVSGKCAD